MAEGAAQQRYWIWAGLTLLAGVMAMIVRLRRPTDPWILDSPRVRT